MLTPFLLLLPCLPQPQFDGPQPPVQEVEASEDPSAVHMATGVKVGEVTGTSAVVWTRLTVAPEANFGGAPWADDAQAVPEGLTLAAMEGAVPGAPGEVRLRWRKAGEEGFRHETPWTAVDPARDFTAQFTLTEGIEPGEHYFVAISARPPGAQEGSLLQLAGFRTPPGPAVQAPARFTVVSCQSWRRRDDPANGHRIYPVMQGLDPDFLVHTGDVVYYDKPGPFAKSPELARHKWNRLYALPFERAFHERVPTWFMTDDHDVLKNDCWPGQSYGEISWEEGLDLYREQTPSGPRPYRRVRWGRDLEVWFMEGRAFRSPNRMPDGPDKSIWGAEQKAWFKRTFAESDATFRVLVSSTPIVGPDRGNKNDNHANKGFRTEGDELRSYLAEHDDVFVICGDRHWQYVSQDPASGVWEFACGPSTDAHAGGFSERNRSEAHRYLKVCGGFLEVVLEYEEGQPRLLFQHRGVDGEVLHADRRLPTRGR